MRVIFYELFLFCVLCLFGQLFLFSAFNGDYNYQSDGSCRKREGKNPYNSYQNFSENFAEHNKRVFYGVAET